MADTVGGKSVLGFGVVWWSIATAFTPIAAKVGLPFLLVVRAFMGIGEVRSFPRLTNVASFIMSNFIVFDLLLAGCGYACNEQYIVEVGSCIGEE